MDIRWQMESLDRMGTENMKIGFIGCGNMGQAMLTGILASGKVNMEDILVSTKTATTREKIARQFQVTVTEHNAEVAKQCDFVFLAVKPQFYAEVLEEIRDVMTESTVLISMAPGKTFDWIEQTLGKPCRVIRIMPNTPALVGEGMMGICGNKRVLAYQIQQVCELGECFSRTELVTENLMDVVTAVSGSSPAYVFMFIEAMADAAVEGGMSRQQAYTFAAQAVLGSAKMVLETGMHPGELKDMVCSPGGTTIQAVRVLEEKGMRAAVMDAMKVCLDKSRNM